MASNLVPINGIKPSATEGTAQTSAPGEPVATGGLPNVNGGGPQSNASEATALPSQTGFNDNPPPTTHNGVMTPTLKTGSSPTASVTQAVPTVASESTSSSNGGSNLSNGAVAGVAIAA